MHITLWTFNLLFYRFWCLLIMLLVSKFISYAVACNVHFCMVINWFECTWFPVRLFAAATSLFHRVQKGIPPWVPLKGQEEKTYNQLQQEAYESKRRDLAVLEANGGVWPGVRTPSHALFLWASGSELTSILEEDHMPNKYIPKDIRCITP